MLTLVGGTEYVVSSANLCRSVGEDPHKLTFIPTHISIRCSGCTLILLFHHKKRLASNKLDDLSAEFLRKSIFCVHKGLECVFVLKCNY